MRSVTILTPDQFEALAAKGESMMEGLFDCRCNFLVGDFVIWVLETNINESETVPMDEALAP